jgi:hypothetical protein
MDVGTAAPHVLASGSEIVISNQCVSTEIGFHRLITDLLITDYFS